MPNLGDTFPNFEAESTVGKIKFHEWLGKSWAILFSHPSDYTPVCTTELAELVKLMPEFEKRKVKVIALSCDSVVSHDGWICDIKSFAGCNSDGFPYPIIADENRRIAVELGMIDPMEQDKRGLPLTARAVFLLDPNAKMRLSILYPATIGRNFVEILRVIDAMMLTEDFKVATPVNWKQGEDVMIQPTVTNEEAKEKFASIRITNLPSGKDYLRQTAQPGPKDC